MKMMIAGVGLAGLALGFIAGRFLPRTQPAAVIEVRNESGAAVQRVEIIAAGMGLAAGESRQIPYAVRGEGGYVVRAVFADGQVRDQADIYTQQGLRQTVRIRQDRNISIE